MYTTILKYHFRPCDEALRPRILALTASPVENAQNLKPDEQSFVDAWETHRGVARSFLAATHAALAQVPDARMSKRQKDRALLKVRGTIELALRSGQDVFDEWAARQQATRQAAADKREAKRVVAGLPPKPPKARRSALKSRRQKSMRDVASERARRGSDIRHASDADLSLASIPPGS